MKHHSVGSNERQVSRRSIVVAAVGSVAALLGMPARAGAAAKGDLIELPPMQLLDGSRIDTADWKGRAGVIVFWSTDCAYCKRHNARLDKLYRSIKERGSDLLIVGIATDGDAQVVRRYLADYSLHFPVALDNSGFRARLTDRQVIPMTILIDRKGRLMLAIPGEMSEDDLFAIGKQLG